MVTHAEPEFAHGWPNEDPDAVSDDFADASDVHAK